MLVQCLRADQSRSTDAAGNCSFFSNYSSTYELVGIDLFDSNNQLIADWTLQDAETGLTVFNATGRVDIAVSEPDTLTQVGVGLFGVVFSRRRAKAEST